MTDRPGRDELPAVRLAWVLASVGEDHRWRDVVAELAKTNALANVETWFTSTRAETWGDAFVVVVPNGYAATWVTAKYTGKIREALSALDIAQPIAISVLTEEQLTTAKAERAQQQREPEAAGEPAIPDADSDQPYDRVREAS